MADNGDELLKSVFIEGDDSYVEMSITNYKVFSAHKDAGFTEDQAMNIVMAFTQTMISTQLLINAEMEPDEDATD